MAEFVYFGENFLPYRIAFRGLKVRTQILASATDNFLSTFTSLKVIHLKHNLT